MKFSIKAKKIIDGLSENIINDKVIRIVDGHIDEIVDHKNFSPRENEKDGINNLDLDGNNKVDYLHVKEFGTVKSRKRRCGWFDVVLVRQSIKISGINGIALTNLDVLDELDEIKVCTKYELDGKIIDYLPSLYEDQIKIKPIYKKFEGWKTSTRGVKNIDALPNNAKKYIYAIEDLIGAKIANISTSPEREDTILIENPFDL